MGISVIILRFSLLLIVSRKSFISTRLHGRLRYWQNGGKSVHIHPFTHCHQNHYITIDLFVVGNLHNTFGDRRKIHDFDNGDENTGVGMLGLQVFCS